MQIQLAIISRFMSKFKQTDVVPGNYYERNESVATNKAGSILLVKFTSFRDEKATGR